MKNRIRIAVVVMGFSGLVAEILLLRELLIVFSGNELSIGIILANWLILEAFGSYVLNQNPYFPSGDIILMFVHKDKYYVPGFRIRYTESRDNTYATHRHERIFGGPEA